MENYRAISRFNGTFFFLPSSGEAWIAAGEDFDFHLWIGELFADGIDANEDFSSCDNFIGLANGKKWEFYNCPWPLAEVEP